MDRKTAWTIRTMSAADTGTVARLRHNAFFEGSSRTISDDAADLRSLIDTASQQAAIVAVSGDAVIGTCLLVANELEPRHDVSPWLAGLVVDPHYRRHGVGAMLVRAVEHRANDFGFAQIYLYTGASERFYERLGWSVIDRFMWQDEQSVLMQRNL